MEIWRRFYPVSLRWLSPEEGGKRNLQNMGEHYYPVFLLDQDVKRESWWSVDVIVANREYDNWHSTELSLVFCDSEASLKVQEKFAPGITFQLYEGPTLVAVGKFLAGEPCRMEYVKSAAWGRVYWNALLIYAGPELDVRPRICAER